MRTRSKTKRQFLSVGKMVNFSTVSSLPIHEAKMVYSKMIYVGSARDFYINGILQSFDSDQHFFVMKQLKRKK